METLAGLQKLCKLYGRLKINGTMMVWDYVNNVAVAESEMKKDPERLALSEKAKWGRLARQVP
jgi:hypothetical protein